MDGDIFDSSGKRIDVVRRGEAFSFKGEKLYRIKGVNIYKLTSAFVGNSPIPEVRSGTW